MWVIIVKLVCDWRVFVLFSLIISKPVWRSTSKLYFRHGMVQEISATSFSLRRNILSYPTKGRLFLGILFCMIQCTIDVFVSPFEVRALYSACTDDYTNIYHWPIIQCKGKESCLLLDSKSSSDLMRTAICRNFSTQQGWIDQAHECSGDFAVSRSLFGGENREQ